MDLCLPDGRYPSHFSDIVETFSSCYSNIFQVDIDENLLARNTYKAEPLICDYLRQRENKLQVDVYCGSIDTQNDCLLNTDVVIGIEM